MIFKSSPRLFAAPLKFLFMAALLSGGSAFSGHPASAALWQEAPPQETETDKPAREKDLKKQEEGQNQDSSKPDQQSEKKQDEAGDKAAAGSSDGSPPRSTRRSRRIRAMERSRRATGFLNIFQPLITQTAQATVEIKKGDRTVALGCIVDTEGYVLTKQSELRDPVTCKLSDGREVAAYVFGVHRETDLALLKIEAVKLPVIRWTQQDSPGVGNWLATVKDQERPLTVGVVGVKARVIRPQSGFMGVNLQQGEKGVIVTNVSEDSPAEAAGLERGDVIFKVNGEPFTDILKLIPKVKSYPPGEKIQLTLLRDNRELVLEVVLGEEQSLNPLFERSNQQNTMGGNALSKRREDFPLAVQHDSVLKPSECGGPVVNLDGEVVGINIARQGRVASLMLPASLVVPIVNELKSGQLAPAVVNKERIEEINRILQSLTTRVNISPVNDSALENKIKQLTREERELRSKLEEITRERIRAEVNFERASAEYKKNTSEIERLKKEREKLVTGTR